MRQWRRIKQKHRGAVLFFRLGDFYEMFQEDALEVSSILNLTLTKRHGIPMCGIPYHASQGYIGRLLREGKKIAICEQISLPKGGRGIAEREVVEIVTPGTVVEEDYLEGDRNNYLLSLGYVGAKFSLSYIDLSTSDFVVAAVPREHGVEELRRELHRIEPREILLQETLLEDKESSEILGSMDGVVINRYPDWAFDQKTSADLLKGQLGTESLNGFGLGDDSPEIFSCCVLLDYLGETCKSVLSHITSVRIHSEASYLGLDESSLRNLEIQVNLQDSTRNHSLLDVLDDTKTTMGARMLRRWLLHPLVAPGAIQLRQEGVAFLYHNQLYLESLRKQLRVIMDLERLSSKIALDKANARELLSVRNSLREVKTLNGAILEWERVELFQLIGDGDVDRFNELLEVLEESIHESPPIVLTEGDLIRTGYRRELDELRELRDNSHRVLREYLEGERRKTGISSLKIRYNKLIGYYLEVTKANLSQVPSHYVRRQSLVGGERFTTERLVELESELNSARERTLELEKELFLQVRARIKCDVELLLALSAAIARVDCLASLASVATRNRYVRPTINNGTTISIIDGRHPVVEAHLPHNSFVPNTFVSGTDEGSFTLITGPNMAGKSTYLRQNALIVLMSQIGSYVPAAKAEIGCVDKIFCRVGASDNLVRGQSTFLVEMNETAYILRTATSRSLIIMDEVGRGTGTNDGLSIAMAVMDYLITTVRAKTLFATHFHELTRVKNSEIKNLSLDVREREGEVLFLKKIRPGPAGNSYGIHVAKLAGIPEPVIEYASRYLVDLQEVADTTAKEPPPPRSEPNDQRGLFDGDSTLKREIQDVNVDELTPIKALTMISDWQKELSEDF